MIARRLGNRVAAPAQQAQAQTATTAGGDPHVEASSRGGRRAFGSGAHRDVVISVAILAVAFAVSTGVLLARQGPSHAAVSHADGSQAAPSQAKYGPIPSWLPKAKIPVGRTVVASAAHPWLAVEGDTVSVRLAHARAMVTAVGPSVPEEGKFPVPRTTPCTFTVTFTAASGAVPLSASAFTILDELGQLHAPRVTAAGGGDPPRFVAAGRSVSLTVRDVLPTGNGQLRWTPVGAKPTVSWDFDVEID